MTRPIKVVFLLPRIVYNSVTFVIYQYIVALRRRGVDAVIAAPRSSLISLDPHLVAPLSAVLDCDVLITCLFVPDIIGWLVSRIRRKMAWVPFLQCHLIVGMLGERKALVKFRVGLWRAALAGAKFTLSPSRYAASSLLPECPSILLPHCLVPSAEHEFRKHGTAVDPQPKPQIGAPAYVYIGRDTPTKRLRSLLRLLALDETARVRLVTDVGFSASALAALSPEQRERCEVVGFVGDPYRHVAPGDIVVCPSGREGFGMVPLECLQRGIDVAVIDEGAFHEFWGGTSMAYSRIEALPNQTSALSIDSPMLRRHFVGDEALDRRVDILENIIAGRIVARLDARGSETWRS